MKKMTAQCDKLNDIMENIDDIISDLEEKRDNIKDNAFDEDRDMTEKEQERYYEIDDQISNLEDCINYKINRQLKRIEEEEE